jgi:hypothetical protein
MYWASESNETILQSMKSMHLTSSKTPSDSSMHVYDAIELMPRFLSAFKLLASCYQVLAKHLERRFRPGQPSS